MSATVFVWIEQHNGQPLSAGWEAVRLARQLAGEGSVTALVFGQGISKLTQAAIQYGADAVIAADDATLVTYRFEPYVALMAALVREHAPQIVLAGATIAGRELLAGVSAEVDGGLLADVTELVLDGGKLRAVRPVLGGKVLSVEVIVSEGVQFATLRGRAFPALEPDASRSGRVIEATPVLSESAISARVEGVEASTGGVSLSDASIIVAGGRGVGGPEGFAPVRELAEALGAAVAASRPAVDAGWIAYDYQVGQTGKVVAPDLYIAAGISGAIQHQAGMRTAKVIVAINKDPEAPIFKLARFGLVGDLFELLPALTAAIKARLG